MGSIDRLLKPRTIAIVGGGSWCENVIRECRKIGYSGEIWPVHPNRDKIADLRAVASVSELENAPDAAFIGVNRNTTLSVVSELAGKGAGGAVCFASGYSEAESVLADGVVLQEMLVSNAGDMPILGPNCYGFINALDGAALWPDQHGLIRVSKGVAIVAQSSNMAINLTMQMRGLPIAYMITVGNQAQTGLSEVAMALLDDERVTAVGLHIEGIDDLQKFQELSKKAWNLNKHAVVIKVGRSKEAKEATQSHTASITGSEAGGIALLKRLGFAQVSSIPAFLEALKILHTVGILKSNRIASMSCSGGEASLMGDTAVGRNLEFPSLSESQKGFLGKLLGPEIRCANPLDYHTRIWGDVDAMKKTFAKMLECDVGIGIVVLDIPREDRCDGSEWFKVIDALESASKETGKKVAVLSSLPETMPEKVSENLMNRGIVPLAGMKDAMEALEAVAGLSNFRIRQPINIPIEVEVKETMSEDAAKSELESYGISTPKRMQAESEEEAVHAAEEIGFPVAVKGLGIAHKSDAGAVELNLNSAGEVSDAAGKIGTNQILVEKMVVGILAELLIGVVRDANHGFVLTVAAGGVLTELLEDSCTLMVPSDRADVEIALAGLKIAPVLSAYRGSKACDMEKIVDAVMSVQEYVMSNPVEEVEINPLLCGEDFAIAADALIRRGVNND